MNKHWRNGAFTILIWMLTMLALGLPASRAQQNSPAYLGVQVVVNDQGTQVVQVLPGSPAEVAGIKPGDLIISLNGEALSPGNSLDTVLTRLAPDTLVPVGITRGGQPMQFTVILGTLPAATAASATTASGQNAITLASPAVTDTALALPAATMSAATMSAAATSAAATSPAVPTLAPATASSSAAFLGVRLVDIRQGVQVNTILAGSPADTAGLKVGDLILAVDNQPVQLAGQVQAALNQKAVGAPMVLRVQRGVQVQEITVHVGTRPASTGSGLGVTSPTPNAGGVPGTASLVAGAAFPAFGFVARLAPDGLRVFSTTPGGPADQGGLQAGDLITQVGTATVNLLDLTPVIVQLATVQPVSVVVIRNGSSILLQFAPGTPATPPVPASGTPEQR